MASRRLAWVVSHPIQYQVPVFRALAQAEDVDLTVLFLSNHGMAQSVDPQFGVAITWDVPLLDGYTWRLVPGHSENAPSTFFSIPAPGLREELEKGYDAVVVSGYALASYLAAAHHAHRLGYRYILLSESNFEEEPRSPARRLVKNTFFRWLVRANDHALATGTRSRRYLEHIGFRPEHIHDYPYCVDTRLSDEAWPNREQLRRQRRAELGISETDVVFIFCGKLMEKKDPLLVLNAFRQTQGPAHLLFAGTGSLEGALKAAAQGDERIQFLGFQNQTDLPALYAASDVLALPSRYGESWGLVVNEAMAMGCGAIVSDRVGSSADLVEGKGTGRVVPAEDATALRDAMQTAIDDRDELLRWRQKARAVVAAHTPTRAAQAVRDALVAD